MNENSPERDAPPSSRAKWQLNIMILVTVVPIALAYLAYYTGWGVPDESVNEGKLLKPAINIQSLSANEKTPLPDIEAERLWRLFIPVTENCEEVCQEHLYLTRQVNIRLAKNMGRVARYAINLGEEQGRNFLDGIAADYPKLQHIDVDKSAWAHWLENTNIPKDLEQTHYYILVDPLGFAMMYYTSEHDGNQLLKDIKRILRYTPED